MKNQRITVRLNEKAAAILAQEHARGISTTELVNQALIGIETSPVMERLTKRNKSELFRKSKLVRICFLLLNSYNDAVSERGQATSLFSFLSASCCAFHSANSLCPCSDSK